MAQDSWGLPDARFDQASLADLSLAAASAGLEAGDDLSG